jgi:hypothetical protein
VPINTVVDLMPPSGKWAILASSAAQNMSKSSRVRVNTITSADNTITQVNAHACMSTNTGAMNVGMMIESVSPARRRRRENE